MKAEIKDGFLVLTMPLGVPYTSKSGKSTIIATTHGAFKTDVIVGGKPLVVSLNAYTDK